MRWSAPQYRAVGLGRDPDDFGDAEIGGSEFLEPADDLVGVRAAGAGMLLTELIPGEVQDFVKTLFADAGQALGLDSVGINRRGVVNERVIQERDSESILTPNPVRADRKDALEALGRGTCRLGIPK